jgi:pyruvate/2-oxoglutarate dehydrogenase complex dihydrolipoamide dehydrogenase (E3) component
MMIRAADALAEAGRVTGLAGVAEVRPDWSVVAARVRDEATDDWDDTVAVERLEKAGVHVVKGAGRLDGPGRVAVGPNTYDAARGVVLNTGTEPGVPPIDGLAGTPYWTNRDLLRAEVLPSSLLVLGGGAIGLELAQVCSRFGVQVTVVEVADRILALEEPESSTLLESLLSRDGIRVLTGAPVTSVTHADGRFSLQVGDQELSAERLLVAAGRRPNLADIGLETVGLDPGARSVEVDDRMRAGDRLWAIGDITGKGAFTHVSMYQAAIAVRDILGQDGPVADYRALSRVTFTDPEVGSVGLTEKQARDAGLSVAVATTDLSASARGGVARAEGLVQLVADTDRGVLVGATSVVPSGGEVLSMLATAVHAEVPLDTLRTMHYAYPTFHRAVLAALDDLA